MSSTFLPSRWRRQPTGSFKLDRGHPLAQSIAFFCVNVNGRFYDLVQNQIGTSNGSAKIAAYSGRAANQAAALASATSDYYSFATNSAYNITGDLSLLWSGTIATGSGYRSFAFKGSGNGSTNCPFDFRTDNSATPKIAMLRSNATTTTLNLTTSVTIPLGVSHQVGASLPVGGGLQVVYLDGASAASSSVGVYTVTSNSNAMLVGRRADGAVQMNGNTEFVIGWSSALTPGAFAELWAAPYQIIKPDLQRTYFGTSGTSFSGTPSTGSLVKTGQIPTDVIGFHFVPTAGSLVKTGQATTLTKGFVFSPSTGSLVKTGQIPTLTRKFIFTPGTASLVKTGKIPILTRKFTFTPGTGSLVKTGQQPTLYAPFTPKTGAIVKMGHIPILTISSFGAALAPHSWFVKAIGVKTKGSVHSQVDSDSGDTP